MNRKNNKNKGKKEQPVTAGEVLEVKINDVGDKGDGIAKIDGFVIFVKNAVKGQRVKIKVEKVLESVAFAKLIEDLDMKNMKNKDYSKFDKKKKSNETKEDKKSVEELFDSKKDSEDF